MNTAEFKSLLKRNAPNIPDTHLEFYGQAFEYSLPTYVKLDLGNENTLFALHQQMFNPWSNKQNLNIAKQHEEENLKLTAYIKFAEGQVQKNNLPFEKDKLKVKLDQANINDPGKKEYLFSSYSLQGFPETDFSSPDVLYDSRGRSGKKTIKRSNELELNINWDFLDETTNIESDWEFNMENPLAVGELDYNRLVFGMDGGIKEVVKFSSLINTMVLKAFGATIVSSKEILSAYAKEHLACRQLMMVELNDDLRKKLITSYTRDKIDNTSGLKKAEFAFLHYPMNVINFIIGAKKIGDLSQVTVMKNRSQFIEDLIGVMKYPEGFAAWERNKWSPGMLKTDIIDIDCNRTLNEHIKEIFSPGFLKDELISKIDIGEFPHRLIAQKLGVEHVNDKQFGKAFRSQHSLETSLAMTKIPENWVTRIDEDGTKINMLLDKQKRNNTSSDNVINGVRNDEGGTQFRDYLCCLGKAFAKLDGQVMDLKSSGLSPEDNNKTLQAINVNYKQLSSKWEWLSKKNPVHAFNKFENDFNISNSLNDYNRMMNIFMDAIFHRAVYSHPACEPEDWFHVDPELNIQLNEVFVDSVIDGYIKETHTKKQCELDDSDPQKNVPFIPNRGVLRYTGVPLENLWDLKELAEKNIKLHKQMSVITKKMGDYATENFEWSGLTNVSIQVGDYTFEPIDNRRRLLQEGVLQNHCAYSYLQKCMTGISSVVSITDNSRNVVVATLEVSQECIGKNEDGDSVLVHSKLQLSGYENTKVNEEVSNAVDIYLRKLDAKIMVSPNDINESNQNESFILDSGFETIADLNVVPFLSDAVYEAYKILCAYLPKGVSVNSIMKSNPNLYALYTGSDFGFTMTSIERFADELSIEINTAIDNRDSWSIPDICREMDVINEKQCSLVNTRMLLDDLNAFDLAHIDKEVSYIAHEYKHDMDTEPDIMSWIHNSGHHVKGISEALLSSLVKLSQKGKGVEYFINTRELSVNEDNDLLSKAISNLVEIAPHECNIDGWLKNFDGVVSDTYNQILNENVSELKGQPEMVVNTLPLKKAFAR